MADLAWRRALWLALLLVLLPGFAAAQGINIDLGDDATLGNRVVQLLLLVTLLGVLPGLIIMITCFPFIVTVLAILRQGIGLQQSPPNMLIVTLALFLTYFVMEPVFLSAWQGGLQPMFDGALGTFDGLSRAMAPFREFMSARVDPATLAELQALRGPEMPTTIEQTSLAVLMPSFLLSEIERAFQIGFLIFLPFLIIDLVVAAVLMSMGMMMVPPAIVSLPFKLAFFVVADGWTLIATSLVRSYS